MSDKRCYYEVLGVERTAGAADIRKAYKKLALKHHPDRNAGSNDAETKFKELTEAYQILSDDDKRRRYDQFGHEGLQGAGDVNGDIFSHVQDLFADFFGSVGPFGGARQQREAARGADLRVRQTLTLEEAVLGCKKDIELPTPIECSACKGAGAEPGTQPQNCRTCGGAGQVSTGRGFIVFSQTCPACHGQGRVIVTPCKRCDGAGWEERVRTVTVTFPAGIDEGHRLRVAGQGVPGKGGGPAGNLYVDVALERHARFERDGADLITRKTITFPEAALGTHVRIELLDGSTHDLELAPGTQPGEVIRVAGKGAPSVNGRGSGSLHVVVQVDVPSKLSKRAQKLLQELTDELAAAGETTAHTA